MSAVSLPPPLPTTPHSVDSPTLQPNHSPVHFARRQAQHTSPLRPTSSPPPSPIEHHITSQYFVCHSLLSKHQHRPAHTMSLPHPASKPPFPDCRICQSASTTPTAPLISPCACRGTCTYVHAACLEEWITRRMRSGLPLSRALICELCHTVYAHDAHIPCPAYFFVGSGAWRRWAHVAYATLIARRLAAEIRLTVTLAREMWKGCADRKRGGAAALAVMTAAHYALFLAIDIRLLWRAFRSWREGACRIVVRDRRQGE